MSPISLGLASGEGLLIRSPVPPWLLGFFMLEAVLACSLNFGWGSVQGIARCSKEKPGTQGARPAPPCQAASLCPLASPQLIDLCFLFPCF